MAFFREDEIGKWVGICVLVLALELAPLGKAAQPGDPAIRREVVGSLPEALEIKSAELREGVYTAWALSLARSGQKRIQDLPASREPGTPTLKNETRLDQARTVTRIAMAVASDMRKHLAGFDVNMDELVAAALTYKIDQSGRAPEGGTGNPLAAEIVRLADGVFWVVAEREGLLAGGTSPPASPAVPFMRMGPRIKVDEALREGVIKSLPEAKLIKNQELRERLYDAWALGLSKSGYKRIEDIRGSAGVTSARLTKGNQADHLRGTARLAVAIGEEMKRCFPEIRLDTDEPMAGGLLHDVGKPYEYDPDNQKRWLGDPRRTGYPALRHPIYGVYIALTAGLPEEICHMVGAHAAEGRQIRRSTAGELVAAADEQFWAIAQAAGLMTK